MGNPISTRLGVNQFWYRHWYSDTSHHLELKQDETLEKLILFYLQYGLTFQTNPFMHEYFYKKNLKSVRTFTQNKHNIKFFRRFFYTNDNLGIEHSYLIRNRTPEYFPMRTWVLKYAGWVIFSIQWFKPLKFRNTKQLGRKHASYVGGVALSTPKTMVSKRIKLLILFLKKTYKIYTF
jgi:hypothetical protein